MTARKPWVAGNWKMNLMRAEARALAAAVARAAVHRPDVDCGVFPPFTSLDMVRVALEGTNVILGAQACHAAPSGAHTGEISAAMLVDAGCRAVLCGHSERRAAGETDADVGARAVAAVNAGLHALVCVGETLAERESGATDAVLVRQLDAALAGFTDGLGLDLVDVAYEPVWAIGTGRTATPDLAGAAHAVIRARLVELFDGNGSAPRILYGGSVKPDNAAELLSVEGVGGVLVGGASLDGTSFASILDAV